MEEYATLSDAARAMVRTDLTVEPRTGATARYGEEYARFVDELIRRGYVEDRWPG
jgi:Arc/MetJ-type ribon-helix-helix transcriptional regulator